MVHPDCHLSGTIRYTFAKHTSLKNIAAETISIPSCMTRSRNWERSRRPDWRWLHSIMYQVLESSGKRPLRSFTSMEKRSLACLVAIGPGLEESLGTAVLYPAYIQAPYELMLKVPGLNRAFCRLVLYLHQSGPWKQDQSNLNPPYLRFMSW